MKSCRCRDMIDGRNPKNEKEKKKREGKKKKRDLTFCCSLLASQVSLRSSSYPSHPRVYHKPKTKITPEIISSFLSFVVFISLRGDNRSGVGGGGGWGVGFGGRWG